MAVWLQSPHEDGTNTDRASDAALSDARATAAPLLIPWRKPPFRKARELLLPPSVPRRKARPIKVERKAKLLKAIARGRQWLDELVAGSVQDVQQIATRHRCSVRHVNMTISLAFLAPGLVNAAIEGRLPRGVGVAALRDAPAEWSHQYKRLGLTAP